MTKRRFIFICLLVAVVILTLSACDKANQTTPGGNDPDITLEYDHTKGILSWYCPGASGYRIEIVKSNGENYPITDQIIQLTQITLNGLKDDTYTVNLTVYLNSKEYTKSIVFTIGEGQGSSGEDNDGPIELPVYNKIVKELLPVYYYIKGEDMLSVPLTNDSGIKSVNAYGLIMSDMYSYDEENNTLNINKSYFERFSRGFKTELTIEYLNGKTDSTYIQIADHLPLQVEGLVDDTFVYDPTDFSPSAREMVFFYNDTKVNLNTCKICVDGKALSNTNYSLYPLSSKIRFSLSFLNSLVGRHLVEVYTDWGKTVLYLEVKTITPNFEKYPYDIDIDFDSSYPNVYITWEMRQPAKNYMVQIGDKKYYTANNADLFDGCKFNATGKIKYNDKVVVSAEFDSKYYQSIGQSNLNVNIYDNIVSEYLSYNQSFDFMGDKHNYYISDEQELRDFVYYSLIYYDSLPQSDLSAYDNKVDIFVDSGYVGSKESLESEINRLSLQMNEAVKGSFVVLEGDSYGEYSIYGNIDSTCVPNENKRTTTIVKGINDVHYSKTGREDDFDGFAINSAEKKAVVYYSEELYLALEQGICPVPAEGTNAYLIYEKAKEILRQIIDDSMTDYQKVHAISDWLADNVAYDYELEKELANTSSASPDYDKFYSYRSLYLEGAFLDGVAVCNGYAKAVSLLCGIEGIPCYKIKGGSGSGEHAWNKVYSEGSWYVVDTTWAVKRYPDSNSNIEILQHQYLFMSELTSGNNKGGKHYEKYTGLYTGYYAGEDYNLYANTFFEYKDRLYDYVIDSAEELQALVDYYKQEYGYRLMSGKYIMIDISCAKNQLDSYIKTLDKGQISQYRYSYQEFNSKLMLKITGI